jgi:signal transduction histidine kinase
MNKPRILIVEDETITSHHLRRVLDRLGYEVVGVAADGASALEQLERSDPDLLVADIGLQGEIDGIEVAARAREDHGIPTVFLTAYSDAETIRRARVSEAYGFIVKPFAEQELQATIEIGLQHHALRTARARELTANTRTLVRTQEELSVVSARLLRVQEHEREEIARDLHDDFGQRLALLQVSIESLWRNLPPRFKQDSNAQFESVLQHVVELAKDLRNVSHRLHPSILNDLGLAVTLRAQAESFEDQSSIPTRVSVRNLPDGLNRDTALALYRIVQEALHNIAKHAGKEATVTIALIGGLENIHLTIRDTGKGFRAQDVQLLKGIGLISMARRAEALGGSVAIDSVPEQGTRIHVSIPFALGLAGGVESPAAPAKVHVF